ncbi:MAG: ribosome maturation factor RimP [Gammaproteobacteria bacterium]
MASNLQVKLEKLVEPLVVAMGYELWDLDLCRQKGSSLLRIYIEKEGGVTLEDCGKLSHQISGVLDVEDPISGKYLLEVSSPGLERRLSKPEHFKRYIGSEVKIRLFPAPELARRVFSGILESATEKEIVVKCADEKFTLALNKVERANLIPKYFEK